MMLFFLHLILFVFKTNSTEIADNRFPTEHLLENQVYTVYVGGLDLDVTDENIYAEFSKYGVVLNKMFQIHRDKAKRSKGCAFVKYKTFKEAHNAIVATNGKTLYGRQRKVCVKFARKLSCEEKIDLYLEREGHFGTSSENIHCANIPKSSFDAKAKIHKPPKFSSFYTDNFDAMLSKILFDRWLKLHFEMYGMHYCCGTNPVCKLGIDSAAECISISMKTDKQFQKSMGNDLDNLNPFWLMWKYSWMNKPDSERLLVHSAEKQNEFVYQSPQKITTEIPYVASTEIPYVASTDSNDDKEHSAEKYDQPKNDSGKSSNVQKILNADFNYEFSKNFFHRNKYVKKKKNVRENKTPEKEPQKATDASTKESCNDKKNVQDCFGNESHNEKQKSVVKQKFLDVLITLIDPNRKRLTKFKHEKLRTWLAGHGLSDEGEKQELIERIENFRKRPQFKEPELASEEVFKFSMIEASEIEKAQNRNSDGNRQIEFVMAEPKALDVNKMREGFECGMDIFNFLNQLIMEIEVREECKGMKKKELQDWLISESGCKSNTWLKVNNEELSNRIWKHVSKNREMCETEMKKIREKREKEKNIIAEYQLIFLHGLIRHGFPGLIAEVEHLAANVQITTTKEQYVVSQAFGDQKKFIYKMKKLPYAVSVRDKRANLVTIYENVIIFGNSPLNKEFRFQIHFIYSGETENDKIEIITGKPFEVMHIFYQTDEDSGFNESRERFKKLSVGEVSVIEYFDNKNVKKD